MSRFGNKIIFLYVFLLAAVVFIPQVRAHEVYVLSPDQINQALITPPFLRWDTIVHSLEQFVFWTIVAALTVSVVFFLSLSRWIEQALYPFLNRLKKYSFTISRVTIGLGFLIAAYVGDSFGPELTLTSTFGSASPIVSGLMIAAGLLIIFGYMTRWAALVCLGVFASVAYVHGWYLLTYTNYLGGIIALLILGGHHASIEGARDFTKSSLGLVDRLAKEIAPIAPALLRICFGISLLYASLYAKWIHNNLALQVTNLPLAGHPFNLAHYFGLDPQFMVMGAGIVEIVIAVFFILGIEIRFAALFLEFWLTLSLLYFGEAVWPHIILIGVPIALFFHGYDKYSLEGKLFNREKLEPFL